jgi:hypothetical protein
VRRLRKRLLRDLELVRRNLEGRADLPPGRRLMAEEALRLIADDARWSSNAGKIPHDSLSRWRSGDARACGRAVLFSNHLWRSRVARPPAARCANPFTSSPAANLTPTFSRPLGARFVKLARLYSVAPAAG